MLEILEALYKVLRTGWHLQPPMAVRQRKHLGETVAENQTKDLKYW